MPWRIEENHPDCDGFAVVRFDPETEEAIRVDGCHDTRAAAAAQMAALYAAEEEEKSVEQASLTDQDAGKSAEVKARARARRPSFDGVEDTPWQRPSWEDFVAGYFQHTAAEPEGDTIPRVAEAPAAMKRWAANKSLLGDENADTFDELVVLPVVNPRTNRLNLSAVRNAIARAPQLSNVSRQAIQSAQEMGRRLLEEHADEGRTARHVKFLGETDDGYRVGGYAVVWGGKDLVGEYFTPQTDFWFDRITDTPIVLYDHGQDEAVKKLVLGRVERKKADDIGLWIETQIQRSSRYAEAIRELIDRSVLGLSSGAVGHLVERAPDGWIKSWPMIEVSLTPTPAEPRTLGVRELRSLVELEPGLKGLVPEESPDKGDSDSTTVKVKAGQKARIVIETSPSEKEGMKMDELIQEILANERNPFDEDRLKTMTEPELRQIKELLYQEAKAKANDLDDEAAERLNSLEQVTKQLSEQISTLLQQMQESPAIRKARYYTVDGGEADKEIKTFGDFLLAIMRNDVKRLHSVYKSTKDMSGVDGSSGGYLVPEEYGDRLFQVAADAAVIRPRAFVYPAASSRGQIPALDQYTAPTAGQGDTAFAGGVVMTWSSEGATGGETQPTFALIEYNLNKLKAFTEVPNELIFDSSQSIDALLTRLFGVAIAGMEDYSFLRGDGVGKPLGILNADAAIAVNPDTNNVFAFADAAEMLSRFHPVAGGNPVWIMHRSTIPDLAAFEVSSGSGGVWMANLSEGIPQSLFGYPILYSEHLPQANNSGHVLLADLGAYAIFEPANAGMSIAFSEHAAFTSDKGTWRVVKRLDGQPWVKNAIPLADPQGSYTVSPFVYFND